MANKVGKPRKFKNEDDLLSYIDEFFEAVAYDPDIMAVYAPTQTDFCFWLKREKGFDCDRRTLYNNLEEYFPKIKEKFEKKRADTLTRGSLMGRYNSTMAIFALKNWCGWSDKVEEKTDNTVKVVMNDELKGYAE